MTASEGCPVMEKPGGRRRDTYSRTGAFGPGQGQEVMRLSCIPCSKSESKKGPFFSLNMSIHLLAGRCRTGKPALGGKRSKCAPSSAVALS